MVITREEIQKRLNELQPQYEQKIADANAINGAIQDCFYWLEQLDKEEKQEQAETNLAGG